MGIGYEIGKSDEMEEIKKIEIKKIEIGKIEIGKIEIEKIRKWKTAQISQIKT